MVTCRRGHSLPELIVTVAVVATLTGAVAASTLLGARWTAEAGARQGALARAATVVDSLLPREPGAGSVVVDGYRVAWEAEGDTPDLVLHAIDPDGDTLVTLRAAWVRPPPVLPAP